MIITSLSSHCFSTKGSEESLGLRVLAASLMLSLAMKALPVVVPLGPLLSDCESSPGLQACAQLFQCLSGACTLGRAVWVSDLPFGCRGLPRAEPL
uniref:Uncharacterized protein n=1 Tax=Cercocebus atys TaxID=9531 RepID=A0A2K5ME71_CERAT